MSVKTLIERLLTQPNKPTPPPALARLFQAQAEQERRTRALRLSRIGAMMSVPIVTPTPRIDMVALGILVCRRADDRLAQQATAHKATSPSTDS